MTEEMENYRMALAYISKQSSDPQSRELAETALNAFPANGEPQSPKEQVGWMRTWPDGCVTFTTRKPQELSGHTLTPVYADTRPVRERQS
jgi:hypothetical protein